MKFSKDFLFESLDDDDATVEDKITGKSRWTDRHRRIFQHDGKLYETRYQVGSTELQDAQPYENDPDEIECPEVVAQEKTITVYVLAPDPAP